MQVACSCYLRNTQALGSNCGIWCYFLCPVPLIITSKSGILNWKQNPSCFIFILIFSTILVLPASSDKICFEKASSFKLFVLEFCWRKKKMTFRISKAVRNCTQAFCTVLEYLCIVALIKLFMSIVGLVFVTGHSSKG